VTPQATGTDFDQLTQTILNLKKNQGTALLRGQEQLLQSFGELGISETDLRTLSADDLFLKIIEGFNDGRLSAQQFAATLKVNDQTVDQDFIGSLTDVSRIAAGKSSNSAAALKTDGTVVAWGGNNHGQLDIPSGLNNVIDLAVGQRFVLALKSA
jgi:hypothetical protein